jgi:hypothetical protein
LFELTGVQIGNGFVFFPDIWYIQHRSWGGMVGAVTGRVNAASRISVVTALPFVC